MTAYLAAWLVGDDGPIAEDERVARAAPDGPWQVRTAGTTRDHEALIEIVREGIDDIDANLAGMTDWHARDRARQKALTEHAVLHADSGCDNGYLVAADGALEHIARWDPARVLAECAAKRAIIGLCDQAWGSTPGGREAARRTLLAAAQPYAGRAGWRAEWGTT